MSRRSAGSGGRIIGWRLDRGQRDLLLERFPARYQRVVADHVTLTSRACGRDLPKAVEARIVGRADDGRGVQAMVVEINGSIERPDGSTFHLTWSLEPGRRAVESNDVIARIGWTALAPVSLQLEPAEISRGPGS